MDVNAMDGTYTDYVKHDEEVQLGMEPNALGHRPDSTPSHDTTSAGLADRVGEVVKEMIDAGNYFWAGRVADALANNPQKD